MRVEAPERVESYDCLYVSPGPDVVLLSCGARLLAERGRGLKPLVLVLCTSPGERLTEAHEAAFEQLGVDHLVVERPPASVEAFEDRDPDPKERAELVDLLTQLRLRSGARTCYLPLGAGSGGLHRVCQDAGLEVFQEEASRNVFLYEERPELFVRSALRVRLGRLGARLPPGAPSPRTHGGRLRFWLAMVFARHLRAREGGLANRLACARRAVREWKETRAWHPTKALGLRLQPVLQPGEAAAMADLLELLPGAVQRDFGSAVRASKRAARYARRLGENGGWVERYWLVLPAREEGGVRTLVPGSASPAA